MQQFRTNLRRAEGIVHMGDWLCAYAPRTFWSGSTATMHMGYTWWPYVYDLKTFRHVETPKRAVLDVGYASSPKNALGLVLGNKVYSSQSTVAPSRRIFYTLPNKRQRLVGAGVNRCLPKSPDARLWMVATTTQATPSLCLFGPKGGTYVRPVHENVRPANPDAWLMFKEIVTRGDYDGSLLTLESADGPSRTARIGEITKYPRRNEIVPIAVTCVPRVAEDADQYVIVTDFEFSPDRKTLAVASHPEFGAQRLDLYDVVGSDLRHRTRYDVPARLVSFSPDGLTLAMLGHTEDDDGTVYLDRCLTLMDMET